MASIDFGDDENKKLLSLFPIFSHVSCHLSAQNLPGGYPSQRDRPRGGGRGRVSGPKRVSGEDFLFVDCEVSLARRGPSRRFFFFLLSFFLSQPQPRPSLFVNEKQPTNRRRSNSGPRSPWELTGSSISTPQVAAAAAITIHLSHLRSLRPRARAPSPLCSRASSPRKGPASCFWESRRSTGTLRRRDPCSRDC